MSLYNDVAKKLSGNGLAGSAAKAQITHKLKAKQEELGRLGRSGNSYGSLTVAEYLSMLGSGSSRPVPPSGGHPKPQ